jgi:hypothetical protein
MFSPRTTTAICRHRNQHHGKKPSSSVTSSRHTSPKIHEASTRVGGGGVGVVVMITFPDMLPYLTIGMVWLIVKSKPGSGF